MCPFRWEHWKLLSSLKTTVEGLLSTNNPNVWSRYGGLQRLHKDMNNILGHGLKYEQVWKNKIKNASVFHENTWNLLQEPQETILSSSLVYQELLDTVADQTRKKAIMFRFLFCLEIRNGPCDLSNKKEYCISLLKPPSGSFCFVLF